jgi:hypothetical protein
MTWTQKLIRHKKAVNLVLVQRNLDACFSTQPVCVTHHKDSTNQSQQDTDIRPSKRKKPALRNNDFFMGKD